MRKTSPFRLIEYIKSSVEILIDIKVQEKLQENKIKTQKEKENNFSGYNTDEEINEYEKLLRKLESDIRTYIKVKK